MRALCLFLLLLSSSPSQAQQTITVRGVVVERESFCAFVRSLSAAERLYHIVTHAITRYERAQIRLACGIQ